MSSDLILKMNNCYNGGEPRAREIHEVKEEMISLYPCLKGMRPFIDHTTVG
jgi:hypothetical protein